MPKMKLALLVALTTTIGLVLAACGGDDPTPTPVPPTPTSPPAATATPTTPPVPGAPTATPTTAPVPTPTSAAPTRSIDPPPATQVNLLASLSFMAEIVEPMRRILEEQSSPVSMTVEDIQGGPQAGFLLFNQVDAVERSALIPWTLENADWEAVSAQSARFPDGVMGPPRVLLKVGPLGCTGIGTLDEDILSFGDLDGKTLQSGSRPFNVHRDSGASLGIDVNYVEHGADDVTVRELKNGQIDASYYHMTGHTRPVPQLLQLLQEQDGAFYHADTKPAIDAIHEKLPDKYPFLFPVPLYAGELKETWNLGTDPIREDVAHCYGGQNPYFSVSAEMDDAVAYEIVYQTVKNREDFRRFLSGDLDAIVETLGMTYRPQSHYHPGARAAFEDLNYPYGLEATIERQRQRAAAHGVSFTVPQSFIDLLAAS